MANVVKIKHRYTGNAGAPTTLGRSELAFNEISSPSGGILYIGTAGESGGDADTKLAIGGPGAFTDLGSAQTVTNKTLGSGNSWQGNVIGAAYLPDATTSAQGVAQFHSDNFSVTSGTVTIKDLGISNDELAGSIANAKLANSSISVTDGSTAQSIALGQTLTFAAVANETTVAQSSGTVTIGLPDDVVITGNLTVNGTQTTINSTTMTVDDKDLILGSVASPSDSTANGGGIILKGANDKKLTYSSTGDKWVFNKALDVTGSLDVTGNIVVSGFVDGRDVASDGSKLDGIAANANNYSHPTHAGDDISVDTGALTGAVVISDLDFNVTTDTLGHVTDANGTVSTRTLTKGDLGLGNVENTALSTATIDGGTF